MLAVRENKRHEVLQQALGERPGLGRDTHRVARTRREEKISLVCADGLKGLEDVISIERLQKYFQRKRRTMSNEELVLLLTGKTAMDKKSYLRPVTRINLDRELFPN